MMSESAIWPAPCADGPLVQTLGRKAALANLRFEVGAMCHLPHRCVQVKGPEGVARCFDTSLVLGLRCYRAIAVKPWCRGSTSYDLNFAEEFFASPNFVEFASDRFIGLKISD